MCKRLCVLLTFFVVLGLVGANTVFGTSIDISIADENDDAEQHLDDGSMDLTSSDLEIPYEDGGVPPTDAQVIGVRYAVDLAPGVTVTNAYLEITADKAEKDGTLEPVNVIIRGELSLDAAQFEGVTNNITDRPTTEASVLWSIPAFTEEGQREQSPDLSGIIQEIISQDGWAAGNGMVLIISDDPDNPSTGLRETESEGDTALLHIEFASPTAFAPVPADGAVEVEESTLEWTAGGTAVSHKVYLSADATIDESDLLTETQMTVLFADLIPGTAYYWRVDEVDADGAVVEGAVWSFATLALEAHFPSPADGATDIALDAQLSWTSGKNAIMHDVYFGTDVALVAAGDPSTFKGKVMVASFDPGPMEPFGVYYWRVDEFTPLGTNAGPVWSFSAPGYIVIEDNETTVSYDNTADPFVSETAWDTPADLRFGGVADLTLKFQGGAASEGSVSLDEATGTYSLTGSGADVWGSADQFHYAYRELTGDAVMIAHVVDNGTGSNAWAKGGVMIRQSLDVGSTHALMAITGSEGGGGAFQWRPAADGDSSSAHDAAAGMAPGYWVKIERVGNALSGSYSADGVTWIQQGDAQTIEMADPVLIGLFVTSHQSGEKRTYTFDNVDIVGDISADDDSTDIGIAVNAPAPIYVALEDSTGAVASVTHGNPAATNIESWRQWTIPLDKFEGVDATSAAKLYIGVGDGQPGGTGSILVDDIRVVKPTGGANIILVSGNHDWNSDGVVDDFMLRDILEAEGYTVDYQPGNWTELDDDKIAALNAADLVIISRTTSSGDYNSDEEPTQWNSITTPMIVSSTHLVRNNRWKLLDSTSLLDIAPAVMELADGTQIDAMDEAVGLSSFIDAAPGNGTVLATGDGLPWIIEWEAGVEYYDGAGQTAGGTRVFFVAGTQEVEGGSNWGEWNLTPAGQEVYLETVDRLLPPDAPSDVTVPGDIVKGVPDDGDWPGAETPDLAIDDNVNTKYLHFKGETEPTGIKITPLDGPSVVTGLSFTTANDAPERDPISFELSGSNDSIDGPYTLIASGDIVDFAQEAAWPRFTKNETPISFANTTEYAHYQVMFPAVRDAASANSMQIAEVELLSGGVTASAPLIVWVSFHEGDDVPSADASAVGFTEAPDKAYTALLTANGYNVTRYITSSTPDPEVLNAVDLVIISRSVSSGGYSNDGATAWNGITAPMIITGGYVLRTSRMGYTTGGTMVDTTDDITLTVNDPAHPIFAGIDLVDGTMVNPFAGVVLYPTDGTLARGVSINNDPVNADGTVLATVSNVDDPTFGGMVIGEWSAGATMEHAGGAETDILAGDRLVFLTGAREADGITSHTAGLYDLYEDGAQMLLNAVEYMLP